MIPEETGFQLEQIGHVVVLVLIVLLIVLLILLFPLLIAKAAKNRGRSGILWFFFALFTTPIIAGFFLLVLGDSKHKWERDIIQQEKIKEKYAAERRVIEAKAKAKREKFEMKQQLKKERELAKANTYKSGLYKTMQELADKQEKIEEDAKEKPCAENDWMKTPTTDYSRYMPH